MVDSQEFGIGEHLSKEQQNIAALREAIGRVIQKHTATIEGLSQQILGNTPHGPEKHTVQVGKLRYHYESQQSQLQRAEMMSLPDDSSVLVRAFWERDNDGMHLTRLEQNTSPEEDDIERNPHKPALEIAFTKDGRVEQIDFATFNMGNILTSAPTAELPAEVSSALGISESERENVFHIGFYNVQTQPDGQSDPLSDDEPVVPSIRHYEIGTGMYDPKENRFTNADGEGISVEQYVAGLDAVLSLLPSQAKLDTE